LLEAAVSIDAPIPQKWPMRPMFVDAIPFHIGHDNLFAIHRALGNDLSARRAHETLPPEFDSVSVDRRSVTAIVPGVREIGALFDQMDYAAMAQRISGEAPPVQKK
jgi:hypothetical protein